MELKARNVNDMLKEVLWRFHVGSAAPVNTRNGRALAITEPTILTYTRPEERVLFSPIRDANPIFHVMESIWIFAGRSDVAFLQQFNSNIKNYSDDGIKFNAPYGHRIRKHFGTDQLNDVIIELASDPESRQAVIQIWDPSDLGKITVDKACNMSITFSIHDGALNMTVFNRSNDLIWGACGANAVQFSFIQEYIASALELDMGLYHQVTNNLHIYLDIYNGEKYVDNPNRVVGEHMHYYNSIQHFPLLTGTNYRSFIKECETFCNDPFTRRKYLSDFLSKVAHPMAMVSLTRKRGNDGQDWCAKIMAHDWRIATTQWAARREIKRKLKLKKDLNKE